MTQETAPLSVSVVIPVYNEIGAIQETVDDVVRHMEDSGLTFEIILVDDGSSDGSGEIIGKQTSAQVKSVHHKVNRGYGAALKTGLEHARYDLIAITDADGTYPNERLPGLIRALGDDDMLVGARVGKNAKIPAVRKPAKQALNKLANYLSETEIPDLNSGFRVMRKPIVKRFTHISCPTVFRLPQRLRWR